MHYGKKLVFIILLLCLFFNIVLSSPVDGCKDIIACGDATDGDYNLLLKVRDPSREDLQVLCIIPKGYEYSYHHPWTGKIMSFKVKHKFIGIASKNDIIPDIVKAGMTLTDSGISYGDADSYSNWINPTKHAWDDFDWIRYACQEADDENEAIKILTEDAVDKLHAAGVSENLFIVGPEKGVVIEADAYRYNVQEIKDGVVVMSNYPKELWKTQLHNARSIAPTFETVNEKTVQKGGVIRLKSIRGIKIVDIGEDWTIVRQVPFIKTFNKFFFIMDKKIEIKTGERKTIGDFSVELLEINDNKARVKLSYKFKAWEDKLMQYIQPTYGSITLREMINWSRLHKQDLDGLRPMCEKTSKYEAVAIYKIPNENYETISSGWFAPNHACSSIYVPFHICNDDIFEPYETGEAAQLSLDLLGVYGHGNLSANFSKTENVFIEEIKFMEQISTDLLKNNIDVSDFLTITDMAMQRQGFLTEEIWLEASMVSNEQNKQEIGDIIANLWEKNYTFTLDKMKTAISDLKDISRSIVIREKIVDIALDICKSRIDAAGIIEKQSPDAEEEYKKGSRLIKQGEYKSGFYSIQKAFTECNMLMKGQSFQDLENVEERDEKTTFLLQIMVIFLIIIILILILVFRKKRS